MGEVWRAFDTRLARYVAIKRILLDTVNTDASRQQALARFSREARVTAQLAHPGVPVVFDAVTEGPADRMYIVMEYVQGNTLDEAVAAAGQVPVPWAATVAAHICTVLACAHALPVVHRDLKPGNIMVVPNGTVRVLDFGIARPLEPGHTPLTASGQMVGTPLYMAPEQCQGPLTGPRADLYALGCILYWLLVGQPPFTGSALGVMYGHCHQEPASIRDLRPEIAPSLEQLVMDLLAKRPDMRPASAHEVYARLMPHLPPRSFDVIITPMLPGLLYPVLSQSALRDAEVGGEAVGNPPDSHDGQTPILGMEVDKRLARAFAHVEVEQFGPALPLLDALASELAQMEGDLAADVVRCRFHAALCRVALGDEHQALEDLQSLLAELDETRSPTDPMVLEVRKQVGLLQWAAHRLPEAVAGLAELHRDLAELHGAGSPQAAEIREALIRIRQQSTPRHT